MKPSSHKSPSSYLTGASDVALNALSNALRITASEGILKPLRLGLSLRGSTLFARAFFLNRYACHVGSTRRFVGDTVAAAYRFSYGVFAAFRHQGALSQLFALPGGDFETEMGVGWAV